MSQALCKAWTKDFVRGKDEKS